jgi:hypothetical protein
MIIEYNGWLIIFGGEIKKMGNNQAFSAFEATVIAVYDKGCLDKELLSSFMEQCRGMDVDSGGKAGLLSKDGLEVEQIVIKTFGGELPTKPDLPQNYNDWTEEQEILNEKYSDAIWNAFSKITDKFGWV